MPADQDYTTTVSTVITDAENTILSATASFADLESAKDKLESMNNL